MTDDAWIYTGLDDHKRECPVCHRLCNAFTAVSLEPKPRRPGDAPPSMKPGDITTCAYCGTILMVTTIGWRPATEAEIDNLEAPLRRLVYSWMPRDPRFR